MNKINIVLTMCVAALLVACIMSISSPMRFEKRVAERERVVKARLIQIRHAAEQFRKDHGQYAPDFQTLVSNGYMADSLQYIPFTDARRFTLVTDIIPMPSGRKVPVMECGATYADYLKGLDRGEIRQLIENAENNGDYPGLRFGDIEDDTGNKGNWEE